MRTLALVAVLVPAAVLAQEKRDDAAAEMAKADDFFFNKKDPQSAIAHYNAARLLAPTSPGPYLALGVAYAQLDDCKSAVPMMQKYLQLKTSDPKPDAQRVLDECKAKVGCPPGQIKNADTVGHCCWPGQVWAPSENHCVGQPACPPGFALGPHKNACLATGSCPPGKVVSQDPRQCCWPGQGYSHEKQSCVGRPVCPPNMVATEAGDDCRPAPTGRTGRLLPRPGMMGTAPPPATPPGAPPNARSVPPGETAVPAPLSGPLDAGQIRAAMNTRIKPLVAACSRQYPARGQVRITFVVLPSGIVRDARVLPPFTRTPLGVCLADTLRSATFPAFTGPVQNITYPFTLR